MLFSQKRILNSAIETLEAMAQRRDVPADVVSDTQAIALMLRHTRYLDEGSDGGMRECCAHAIELLEDLRAAAATLKITNPGDIGSHLDGIIASAREVLETKSRSAEVGDKFFVFLYQFDTHLGAFLHRTEDSGPQRLLADHCEKLLAWQTCFDPAGTLTEKPALIGEAAPEPLLENLQKYMREKLHDDSAIVENLVTIPGGFGHQTVLFSVRSESLCGDLVMRRGTVYPHFNSGVDCLELKDEFSLLKAVFARGFPVAEPLWFEERSRSVPGPAFIISRRAFGEIQGDVLGGRGRISDHLRRELAITTARIHTLPLLEELGDQNPALQPSMWYKNMSECIHSYITAWYENFLKAPHIPAPGVYGLFNWLLSHVPVSDETPTLVHGDIGLHNLLIQDSRLSAVLDWETAHIGDPAEDIAYIRNTVGNQLDWPMFIREYQQTAGRPVPDSKRLLFWEIWGHARNAGGCACTTHNFETGASSHVRYGLLTYRLIPQWLERARQLISKWDS